MGYKNTERPGYLSNSTAAMPKDCTVHLFSLKPGLYPGAGEVIAQVANQDKVESSSPESLTAGSTSHTTRT
jgi:hypothetical protein